ncbi:MAG: GNAT family N-acetyltransferase [Bdellovibrionaceae bacterium]|nr:GNAT family N-acetyltransferase [Bdellovibrio sp.]
MISKKVLLKLKTTNTRRLTLRLLTKNDYRAWFESCVDRKPAANKWDRGPRSPNECTKMIFTKLHRRLKRLADTDDYYRYYIFKKKSGKIVGEIDFDIFVRSTHQFSNYGYQIYNPYWGHGYGQEAARAGLKIGFKDLKLNRLEAAINLDNRKSIRLVKAIGMHKEGIKKRYWFENKKWVDHLIYVANPENIGVRGQKPIIE